MGGRRKDHRVQHQAALRAVPQPVHHAFAQLRVPLFLHAQAVVRLPFKGAGGVSRGFGTLDEMFEILTLTQTQKLAKKITVIIYGSEYWKKVFNLDVLVDTGAISPKDIDLFQFADTPEEAFEMLRRGLTENYLAAEVAAA